LKKLLAKVWWLPFWGHGVLTASNLQYSAIKTYWILFSANPAISFFSSTGDCPISLSTAIAVSVTHFSVYGAGTTSVTGQHAGGFTCHKTPSLTLMNALNINSSHSPTKFSRPDNLTNYTVSSLCSLHVALASHLLSHKLDHLYLTHYKSPTALLDMHHLTCGISSLLHSVNLILFTHLLVHLILCISPHIISCHHLRSYHLSLPQSFIPDLKLITFTILSSIFFLNSFWTVFTDL